MATPASVTQKELESPSGIHCPLGCSFDPASHRWVSIHPACLLMHFEWGQPAEAQVYIAKMRRKLTETSLCEPAP